MPLGQAEGLIKERVAVRAGDRGLRSGKGQRHFLVGIVPVRGRDEILPAHRKHRAFDPLRLQIAVTDEPIDLPLPLLPELFRSFLGLFGRGDDPSMHGLATSGPRLPERSCEE